MDQAEWLWTDLTSWFSLPQWYLVGLVTSGFMFYYYSEVAKKPRIVCSKGNYHEFLQSNVPLLSEKFWPTIWCFEARAQTLLASLVRTLVTPCISYRREIITLKDGGQVCLDWLDPFENCPPDTPTVIILPGLTGASQADYVKGLALSSKAVGIRVVVFNQRGIGGISLKTPRTYCAANNEDTIEVVDHVVKSCPGAMVAATGISMGGLILGHYLTTVDDAASKLTCAMLISVPWNVMRGSESIETSVNKLVFNRHLASCLCEVVKRVRHIMEPGPYVMEEVLQSKTIREFDSRFTVKQFGFRDVTEYYEKASLHDKIHKTQVPLLCLSAADDPFQPLDGIPVELVETLENVCIVVTARGGHIGFIEGIWPLATSGQYMYKLFQQFFQSTLFTGSSSGNKGMRLADIIGTNEEETSCHTRNKADITSDLQ